MTIADLISVLYVFPDKSLDVFSVGCCDGCIEPVEQARVVFSGQSKSLWISYKHGGKGAS